MFTELEIFRDKVSDLLWNKVGITWADACGDDQPLILAIADRERPDDFVDHYIEKYNLELLEHNEG